MEYANTPCIGLTHFLKWRNAAPQAHAYPELVAS